MGVAPELPCPVLLGTDSVRPTPRNKLCAVVTRSKARESINPAVSEEPGFVQPDAVVPHPVCP